MACKCGSQFIVNKTHNLCSSCNYVRLHGKSRLQAHCEKVWGKMAHSDNSMRKPLTRAKKGQKIVSTEKTKSARLEILRKDKSTYYDVFVAKPNYCEECGAPLPDVFADVHGGIVCISQYSHILGKQAWPEFRHNPKNFNRLCVTHHRQWENKERTTMRVYPGNQLIIDQLFKEYHESTPERSNK